VSLPGTVPVDSEFLPAPARGAATTRACTLFGIPVTFGVSCVFATALGTWTVADALLPLAAPGRSMIAYWTGGAAVALLVLMSVVVHELGHAIAALRAGLGVRGMALSFFGGATDLVDAPRSPGSAAAIAVAGPVASLGLAVAFAVTHIVLVELDADALTAVIPAMAAVANLAIAALNVLPGLPLDGGHLLAAVVWWLTGRATNAIRVAARVGRALAIALGAIAMIGSASGDAGIGLWCALIAVVMWCDAERARAVTVLPRAAVAMPQSVGDDRAASVRRLPRRADAA
jgi:Zn-dependent protease